MGFVNPILGGGGALVRAAVKSPNFLTGVSGWTIKRDGSAEFNNLVIRGEFRGTEFIIDSDGLFLYNGTPALGNLIGSMAGASGVDQFGNAYDAGFTMGDNAANTYVQMSSLGSLFLASDNDWDNPAALSVQPPLSAFGVSTVVQSATNNTAPGDAAVALILDPGNEDGSGDATVRFDTPFSTVPVNLELGDVDQGRGIHSQVSIVASVTGITATETVLMTLPSATYQAGRAYRVTLWGLAQSTTAGTYFLYRVRKGSATTSGTIYKDQLRVPLLSLANTNSAVNLTFLLVNASGADITTALTWTGSCAAGTGIFSAAAGNVATATVEDVGSASDWPGQPIT